MKKFLAAAAALGALAAVGPAFAHSSRDYDRDYRYERYDRQAGSIRVMQERVYRALEIGVRTGELSGREAGRLRGDFSYIDRLAHQYSRNGFTRWERENLMWRLNRLADLIRWERNDWNDHRG